MRYTIVATILAVLLSLNLQDAAADPPPRGVAGGSDPIAVAPVEPEPPQKEPPTNDCGPVACNLFCIQGLHCVIQDCKPKCVPISSNASSEEHKKKSSEEHGEESSEERGEESSEERGEESSEERGEESSEELGEESSEEIGEESSYGLSSEE